LGRWLNRDPIQELGGLNVYAIVHNNPVNSYDPLGEVEPVTIVVGGITITVGQAVVITGTAACCCYLTATPAGRRNMEDMGRGMIGAAKSIGEGAKGACGDIAALADKAFEDAKRQLAASRRPPKLTPVPPEGGGGIEPPESTTIKAAIAKLLADWLGRACDSLGL